MRIAFWISFATIWLAGIAVGSWSMMRYESTPATVHVAADMWPVDSSLRRDTLRPTLLMFVHPRCPCSRASVGESTELAARVGDKMAMTIIFIKPAGFGSDWEKTDLWRSAEAIPGANVVCDVDGIETRRFHSEASGETMLYLPNGELAFHGGITASRGHRGESAGRAALEQLLAGESTIVETTPVFGCSLLNRKCLESASHSSLNEQGN